MNSENMLDDQIWSEELKEDKSEDFAKSKDDLEKFMKKYDSCNDFLLFEEFEELVKRKLI